MDEKLELNVNPQAEVFFETDESQSKLLYFGLLLTDSNNESLEIGFDRFESLGDYIEIVKQLEHAVNKMKTEGIQAFASEIEVIDLDKSVINTTEDIQGWDML